MNVAVNWSKTNVTLQLTKHYFKKHGHCLKWRDYKENILEVGCGEGSVTAKVLYPYIKNHTQRLLATDKLEEMVTFAKQHNKMNRVDYQVMDIMNEQQVKALQNQFDHIFSLFLSHWIPDTRTMLSGFHQMLKMHGQILVIGFIDSYLNQCVEKLKKESKWRKYISANEIFANYTQYPKQYLENLLQELGFNVDVYDSEKTMLRKKNLIDTIRATMHFYPEKIPAELEESYIQDFLKCCHEMFQYIEEPDTYEVPYETMILIATKIK